MIKLVFSYSHADESLRNELEKHLSPLKRQGIIDTWHDRRIMPGEDFTQAIDTSFTDADIILLLVSADFINSDYCYEVEMQNALNRHKAKDAVVLPVILRECMWHDMPFGHILAATVDGKPITEFPTLDQGFTQVAQAVSRISKDLSPKPLLQNPIAQEQVPPAQVSSGFSSSIRTSNLAIKKHFTDQDYDQALREGAHYMANFFRNSMEELVERNPELQHHFLQKNAEAFECTLYHSGNKISFCGIWLDSGTWGTNSICYNSQGVQPGSYNDSFNVADDGNIIGYKNLMGVGSYSGRQDELFTAEGMAEVYWDKFIAPLK